MPRKIHKHPVEVFVDTYLIRQSKARKIRVDEHILDKAAKLIGIALRNPCCEPAEEVVYETWQENWFIKAINALLINIDRRKWRASLERAKERIENLLIQICCTVDVEVTFPFSGANNMLVQFTGLEGQGTFSTELQGGTNPETVIILTMPAKGKYNISFQTTDEILFGSLCLNETTPFQNNFGLPLCRSGAPGVAVKTEVYLDFNYAISEGL